MGIPEATPSFVHSSIVRRRRARGRIPPSGCSVTSSMCGAACTVPWDHRDQPQDHRGACSGAGEKIRKVGEGVFQCKPEGIPGERRVNEHIA